MSDNFAKLMSLFTGQDTNWESTPRRSRVLSVEQLEDRAMMSVSPWSMQVSPRDSSSIFGPDQSDVAVASTPNGTAHVAVWSETTPGTSDGNIKGQIYNSYGQAVGGVFYVATSSRNEFSPDVAMDLQGNVTVVWVEENTWGSQDIRGAQFTQDGRRLRNFTVASTSAQEYDPSIDTGLWGSMFIVSYTSERSSTNPDIRAGIFYNNGQRYRDISVWSSNGVETNSSVAASTNGDFIVAYERHYSSGNDNVQVTHFTAGGGRNWSRTLDASTRSDLNPDVAIDASGEGVVVFEATSGLRGSEIRARQFNRAGVTGSEMLIVSSLSSSDFLSPLAASSSGQPVVATRDMDEGFVVAYETSGSIYGRRYEATAVAEVSGTGVVVNGQVIGSGLTAPAVTMLADGHYFVAADNGDIHARSGYFNLSTEGHKVLYLNFEGATLTRAHLASINDDWDSAWGSTLNNVDPDGNGVRVDRYLANRSDRQQIIDHIVRLVSADLAPYGVEVRLHTGGPVRDQQATTVFIGPNNDLKTKGAGGTVGDIDAGNDNRTDVAFVDEERYNLFNSGFTAWNVGGSFHAHATALATADSILHEAGHTFGLEHVWSGMAPETMGLRPSNPLPWRWSGTQWYKDATAWIRDTYFTDAYYRLRDDLSSWQNSHREMLAIFGDDASTSYSTSFSISGDTPSSYAVAPLPDGGKHEAVDSTFADLGRGRRKSRASVSPSHANNKEFFPTDNFAQALAVRRGRPMLQMAARQNDASGAGASALEQALLGADLLPQWESL